MARLNDPHYLGIQYATNANLDVRIALHQRFSTATEHFHDWLFDHIALPQDAHVLEIGCGSGALWQRVTPRIPAAWQFTLTDFSYGMAAHTREHLASRAEQFHFAQSDAQAIPFANESFDGIIANHMLYHVPDVARAVSEIRRVLKRGGKFYAATNGEPHMHELRTLITALTGAAFSMVERGFSLDNGAAILRARFEQVTRDDFDDALEVTDAGALVAYVLSGAPFTLDELAQEKIGAFREIVQNEIDTRGAFHITKSVGLFIAR